MCCLVLGWVDKPPWHVTGHTGQLSLKCSSTGWETTISQNAMMPCGWDVKAGMANPTCGDNYHISDFDLWLPKSDQVISRGWRLFPKFHWDCSSSSWNMELTSFHLDGLLWPWPLTFDLRNLIRSSVWASEHALQVSSKLLNLFMRHYDNDIYPDEWTNKRTDRQRDSLKA